MAKGLCMTAIAVSTELPVLLLIPGMLNTSAVWSRVAVLLQGKADIRIANVQTQVSIGQMARDAWTMLADVPPTRRLVVCGFSMGGYVALEMIAGHARLISALGLFNTSARPETPESTALREKTIAAIERNFPRVVEGVLQFGTHSSTQSRPGIMDELRQIMLDVGAETAIRQNRAIMQRADYRELLPSLAIPTLVVCARDDKITPPALSEELAALIPGARLEWIDDAGHMTPVEQPERLAQLLKSLL
jgi:pimeloyl-ACP methyl ester carboxylesterase